MENGWKLILGQLCSVLTVRVEYGVDEAVDTKITE